MKPRLLYEFLIMCFSVHVQWRHVVSSSTTVNIIKLLRRFMTLPSNYIFQVYVLVRAAFYLALLLAYSWYHSWKSVVMAIMEQQDWPATLLSLLVSWSQTNLYWRRVWTTVNCKYQTWFGLPPNSGECWYMTSHSWPHYTLQYSPHVATEESRSWPPRPLFSLTTSGQPFT